MYALFGQALFTAIGFGAIVVGAVAVAVGMSPSFRARFTNEQPLTQTR
jgi:hypothetical protein